VFKKKQEVEKKLAERDNEDKEWWKSGKYVLKVDNLTLQVWFAISNSFMLLQFWTFPYLCAF